MILNAPTFSQVKKDKVAIQAKNQAKVQAKNQSMAKAKKILIIGDSLTAGYGVAKKDSYPTLLEEMLNKNNKKVKIINAGTSGSTSASAHSRVRWHLRSKPDILIIALGANDGLRGIKTSATKKNLLKAIDLAKKESITVYLASMKLPYNYGEDYRKDFETVFKEIIKEEKIKLIPFLLKGVGGVPKYNISDGIHPNENGHKIVAANIFKFLEKEL